MKALATLLSLLCLAGLAFAQGDRGTITGTVSDPTGAVVAGAAVTATNIETGAHYDTVTTSTGNYTLSSLPAGGYDITVSAPGFSKFVQHGLRVQVAMTIRVDVVVQVGTTNESITVTAAAALIRSENAEQSQTITGERINSLPLNFGVIAGGYLRSPFAFMNLTPGALQSGQNVMRVNGFTNSVTMRIEGQDATNTNSDSRIDELQPSVEAVQEFTLQTSNFAPEYGQVGGGIFNFTTKSGTNEYHGSAYENFSNEALNAGAPWTDDGNGHLVRPRARKHDFGFSGGGPVWIPHVYNGKNRTFFFFNIEFYRDTKIASGTYQTVPTLAMREGDFSGVLTGKQLTSGGKPAVDPLGNNIYENVIYDPASTATLGNGSVVRTPFVGNRIPISQMDPVALAIQKLIPAPTNNLAVNNWQQVYPNNKQMNVPSIKIDQNLNEKMKASFYFSRFSTNQYVNPDGLPVPLTQLRILYERNDTWRSNFDYTVSPTLLLHLGAGYIRYRNPDVMVEGVRTFDSVGQLGLKGSALTPAGFPRITGLSGSLGGFGLNMGPSNGNLYFEDKPTAIASLTYVRGNHTYKLGADWRIDVWTNRQYNQALGNYTFNAAQTGQPSTQASPVSGGSVGYAYASFLLGEPATATVGAPGDPQYRRQSYSLFIQDNWKVTRRLTLDYGLRWDLAMPTREIFNRWSMFDPAIPNPAAGGLPGATIYEGFGPGRCNCQFTNVYPYAIGPRIGGAFQINSKTVLRGGWGLTYTPLNAFGYLGYSSALGTGWNTLSFAPNNSWDPALLLKNGMQYNPADLYGASFDPGIRPQAGQINNPPNLIDPNSGRPGRISQWTVSLQREITSNLVVEAAYVGSRGAWLTSNSLVAFNDLTPQRLASFGLDINNAADRTLLRSTITNPAVVARGFKLPYPGFPTGQTLAQALRPFPQFGNLGPSGAPLGNSWYDALQSKVTKRFSHGMELTSSFTWQKEMDTQEGVNDVFNRPNQKSIASTSQPFQFVTAYNYEVPKLTSSKLVRAVVGGWTFGGVLRYASGTAIAVPPSNNNLSGLLEQSTRMNRVPGQPLFLVSNLNCGCFDPGRTYVLNPKAWSDPTDGQWGFGPAYYSDYRNRRQPDEEMSLGRIFRLREKMTLQIRAEFFNVFNRTVFPAISGNNPIATPTHNANGLLTGGFGYYNTASANNVQTGGIIPTSRNGQLVARFQW
ncbi:MAG TPA: TonB-dependent receptor [Bryobacteraceae bacterium]|nr:TonB-dependent receptor [Bryobacteraceae bacterium]